MPTHDIDVTVPATSIKNKDMEVAIRADGRRFGRVKISRGSIDWVPANSDLPRRMTWEQFARIMDEHGRVIRQR